MKVMESIYMNFKRTALKQRETALMKFCFFPFFDHFSYHFLLSNFGTKHAQKLNLATNIDIDRVFNI